LAVGNLSAAAAIGGIDMGASLAAAALSGRPISGEPGGNAGAAGACAVGAGAGAAAAGAGSGGVAGVVGVAGAGAAVGGDESLGAVGCWPFALNANNPAKTLASNTLRDADDSIVIRFSLRKGPYYVP